MNETKTFITAIKEELCNPTTYRLCPTCNVEFPIKPKYFHDSIGPCLFCQQSRQQPADSFDTDFTIPSNPEEKKCAHCGRNFKDNNHNFTTGYVHPSGDSPCCIYCQGDRIRAVHYLSMTNRRANQAELDAIQAAQQVGDIEEVNRLIALREAREKARREQEGIAQVEAADIFWRKEFVKHKMFIDRSGNQLDPEGNVILQPGQDKPWNIFNPKPQQTTPTQETPSADGN